MSGHDTILYGPAATSRPGSGTADASLIDGFLSHVAATPEAPALWVDGALLSYAALGASAAVVAKTLTEIAPDDGPTAVAVIADRSRTTFAAILGALGAGFAYVPIHPKYPVERNLAILDKSGASILVTDEAGADVVRTILLRFDAPMSILWCGPGDPPPDLVTRDAHRILRPSGDATRFPVNRVAPAASRIAYILFTSGSTGEPKGVAVSHANVMAYVDNIVDAYRPGPTDRFSQMFDLTFDLSVHDLFVPWTVGASVYCTPAGEQHAPGRFARRHALTFWFSTPSTAALMERLKVLRKDSFPDLRVSLFCGEALPTALAQAWAGAAPNSRVENLYGPTEATIAITAHAVTSGALDADSPVVPIGRPFPGQAAALLGPSGRLQPLADGAEGELILTGDQLTLGYWRNREITERRFPVGLPGGPPDMRWYRTGDKARYDEVSGFHFLGRLDHQVKVRGHRVELPEVEAVLRWAGGTSLVAALAWPRTATGADGIVAFLAGTEETEDALRAHCAERLPVYMLPRRYELLREMPRNTSGKIDRGALLALLDRD